MTETNLKNLVASVINTPFEVTKHGYILMIKFEKPINKNYYKSILTFQSTSTANIFQESTDEEIQNLVLLWEDRD